MFALAAAIANPSSGGPDATTSRRGMLCAFALAGYSGRNVITSRRATRPRVTSAIAVSGTAARLEISPAGTSGRGPSVKRGAAGHRTARRGGSGESEDSRTDDRADAECGERPGAEGFLQTVLGKFRVADQLVDRFGCEQLLSQRLGS